jgi:hypothetical protein
MRRTLQQPIKVIDDFFEAPSLWRHFGLQQQLQPGNYPGLESSHIDSIKPALFHSIAAKLIKHIPTATTFSYLKITYSSVDKSYNTGWIKQSDPACNISGTIFLEPNPVLNTGLQFFNKVKDSDQNYYKMFDDEVATVGDRSGFIKYKEEQLSLFKRTMSVENIFNRCVMFHPDEWHRVTSYYGNSLDTNRLVINFVGIAI